LTLTLSPTQRYLGNAIRAAVGRRNIEGFPMAEGYCIKCKAKKEIADAVEETTKTGRKAIKGKCPTCGTVMFKILGGKAPSTSPVSSSLPNPTE
jgi:Zn finger protein HypA/HybF involved in hydrogenase expression